MNKKLSTEVIQKRFVKCAVERGIRMLGKYVKSKIYMRQKVIN